MERLGTPSKKGILAYLEPMSPEGVQKQRAQGAKDKEAARQLAEKDVVVLKSKNIGKNVASLVDLLSGEEEEARAMVARCPRILAVRDLRKNMQALAELMDGDKEVALEVLRSKPAALMDRPSRMKAARTAGYCMGSSQE